MLLRRLVVPQLLAFLAALSGAMSTATAAEVIRLGVTAGPHAQIAEVAKKVAARDGLEIRIVELPWVAKLVKAFQSPEVRSFVSDKFAGSMVPAF